MTQVNHKLFDAFREDHAVLGRGLHELRSLILAGDIGNLKTASKRLDRAAGGHIAFEEEDFYPALKSFLSSSEVDGMYADHAFGAETLKKIAELDKLGQHQQKQLLQRLDNMEQHVSECGELFGALGGLEDVRKEELYEQLLRWRRVAPGWTEYASKRPDDDG